jgi:predicted CXXCH cytochrome family protein
MSRMSSRKKPSAPRQPAHKASEPPAATPRRRRYAVWAVAIVLGVLIGAAVAVVSHFSGRSRVELGTLNPTTAPVTPADSAADDARVYAAYAGSASCRECHPQAYDLWSKSHHGLAERKPDPAIDKVAFDPPRSFTHGTQKTEVRAQGDHYEVVTQGYEKRPSAYPVERVIGVDPLRQYLTPAPGGRLQTLEASYDPRKNEWFNVYGSEDRRFGEWGHWTGRGMNWNSMCAACHNTRVRKNYDEPTDAYRTAMAEMTVSCESCHGPMKPHVDAKKKGLATSVAGSDYKRFTKDQTFDTCGSCHARRADLTGDFAPGDGFDDHYSLTIPDLSDLFYPDGQVRDEDYEFTAFNGSKMHAAGVRCVDCHEPHSSKRLFEGNNLCMRCHNGSFKGSPVIVPEQHSFHKPDSAGNQCVNCHMPQTTYMQRHGRHDHGFTIPDPLLTKEHQIPNACNRCHTDKDADWSLAAVDKWYGPKMQRPSRDRARAIAKARRGDASAGPALLKLLAEETQPFWQAVAAATLAPWAGVPDVHAALIKSVDHASPLVRENAAQALASISQREEPAAVAAVTKLLNDPVRSVRVRAARAMPPGRIDPASQAGKDLLTSLRVNGDQPAGAWEQAKYHAARGEMETAVAYARKAVTWNPNEAPFRDTLADFLILTREHAQAAVELEWATKLAPRDAGYLYKLALLYDKLGRPDDAVNTIARAEAIDSSDPEMPYARATILLKLGRTADARAAARRALQINPNYEPAQQLLQTLPR